MNPRARLSTLFPYTTLFRSLKHWGSFGRDEGQFNLPHAMVLDREGTVYVADRNNARIQVFDGNGTFQRFRSEEHTSELQSQSNLVCRLLLEKKKKIKDKYAL